MKRHSKGASGRKSECCNAGFRIAECCVLLCSLILVTTAQHNAMLLLLQNEVLWKRKGIKISHGPGRGWRRFSLVAGACLFAGILSMSEMPGALTLLASCSLTGCSRTGIFFALSFLRATFLSQNCW